MTFWDNGVEIGSVPSVNTAGQASITIPSLTAGYHSFQAKYAGTTNFTAGQSNYVTISDH